LGGTIPTQISVTADTTGSYISSSVSVGSYDVTASATGQTTATATTEVTQAATTTLNIQLSAPTGGTCTGSTVNRDRGLAGHHCGASYQLSQDHADANLYRWRELPGAPQISVRGTNSSPFQG
jgi:hypothetical protein